MVLATSLVGIMIVCMACRGFSRQEYLKKREEQKLVELRQELEDEEYLFSVSTLLASESNSASLLAPCLSIVGEMQLSSAAAFKAVLLSSHSIAQ